VAVDDTAVGGKMSEIGAVLSVPVRFLCSRVAAWQWQWQWQFDSDSGSLALILAVAVWQWGWVAVWQCVALCGRLRSRRIVHGGCVSGSGSGSVAVWQCGSGSSGSDSVAVAVAQWLCGRGFRMSKE
jgi:hypothetical protein